MMNESSIDWRKQQQIFQMPISSVPDGIFKSIQQMDLVTAERMLVARFGELDWEPLQDVLAHLVFAYEYIREDREAGRFERALLKIHRQISVDA